MAGKKSKLKIAVWKFASCDGCQLSFLDCEDELLTLAEHIEIAHFPEATKTSLPGPYDVSFVEGSLSTPEDLETIQAIRKDSRLLISIGACATSGGIQALRNFAKLEDYVNVVYAHPEYINVLDKVIPIAKEVKVDLELFGCPISKRQLLEAVNALLNGRRPQLEKNSVCTECKLNETECLVVTRQEPCLGPVTQSGCQALCPSYDRACFGCFGPKDEKSPEVLAKHYYDNNIGKERLEILFSNFNVNAAAFRKAKEKLT